MRDYIGAVRIPLKLALTKGKFESTMCNVVDEQRRECGKLEVEIEILDSSQQ